MNVDKIREHYEHAKEKHPYFCDGLLPKRCNPVTVAKHAHGLLSQARNELKKSIENGDVVPVDVLNCEVWEMNEAVAKGDKKSAVEECYDAIAVLLRTIDVLEGRQTLGKPEGGAK